jgi:hypothetical protein
VISCPKFCAGLMFENQVRIALGKPNRSALRKPVRSALRKCIPRSENKFSLTAAVFRSVQFRFKFKFRFGLGFRPLPRPLFPARFSFFLVLLAAQGQGRGKGGGTGPGAGETAQPVLVATWIKKYLNEWKFRTVSPLFKSGVEFRVQAP